jgi:hypothetical protein
MDADLTAAPADPDEAAERAVPPPQKRLSHVLRDLAGAEGGERVTLGELLEALEERAAPALMIVFAFPNILPSPPGLAAILGAPLLVLAMQLMLGRSPWLPEVIARRSLARTTLQSMLTRAVPYVERAERYLRPRGRWLSSATSLRGIGLVCTLLSVLLMLPVPFGNMAPSVAVCVLALGVLERDGLWVAAGLVAALGAAVWVVVLGYAVLMSAVFLVMNAL